MPEKKALVFDDNMACQVLLSEILMEKDFAVTPFSEPTPFIADHPNGPCPMDTPCVNAILTDNQMPGMTGLELLKNLKARNCKLPDHRKAIISGNWTSEELKQVAELGCKVFHKPTPLAEIHAWLDDCD